MSELLELTQALVARPSLTPDDAGCQALIGERLEKLGFVLEPMRFGKVDNLWARRGATDPLLVFAGHTDVVPTGDLTMWRCDPFTPTIEEGVLYGRGCADMKGALAAMVVAVEGFVAEFGDCGTGSIGFLLTSDEEGPAVDGTVRVVDTLNRRGERIDYCVVGEPSGTARTGDCIRVGRRGSLSGRLRVRGVQGHVAYPDRARNPIHEALPALAELTNTRWDTGNTHFPPTSLQISNIHAGTGAGNVIPGELVVDFNFRFATSSSAATLKARCEQILVNAGCDFSIDWQLGGEPFLTSQGALLDSVSRAIVALTGTPPQASTGGGTSDGRFIAPTGTEVVELGVPNPSIHKINEQVRLEDLELLERLYRRILTDLLGRGGT